MKSSFRWAREDLKQGEYMMRLLSSRTYNSDSKKRTIYLCVILYKIVLDFTYITASEVYSYRGIVLDFNIIKYALSWFYLFLLMSPFLKKKENKYSRVRH